VILEDQPAYTHFAMRRWSLSFVMLYRRYMTSFMPPNWDAHVQSRGYASVIDDTPGTGMCRRNKGVTCFFWQTGYAWERGRVTISKWPTAEEQASDASVVGGRTKGQRGSAAAAARQPGADKVIPAHLGLQHLLPVLGSIDLQCKVHRPVSLSTFKCIPDIQKVACWCRQGHMYWTAVSQQRYISISHLLSVSCRCVARSSLWE
jgi:hypothetical protein